MRTSTRTTRWSLALALGLAACGEAGVGAGDGSPSAPDPVADTGGGPPPPGADLGGPGPVGDAALPEADGAVAPGRDAAPPPGCDPVAALSTCQACHGPRLREAGLDLSPAGLEERLVGVASTACPSRRLVDTADPERSLLLAVVDPARHASLAADGCALSLMPPGRPGLAPADVACLETYVRAIAVEPPAPPPVDAVSVDSALAKVKTLLTGEAPTAEDRALVAADPANLRALVDAWTQTPAFEAKLLGFLRTALQQDLVGALEEQLDKPRGYRPRLRLLEANVADSFARTALRIVREGRPFTEIATTREWEMTTALAMVLAYADQDRQARNQRHAVMRTPPDDAPRPVTPAWMVRERTWVVREIPAGCGLPGANGDAPDRGSLDADRLLDFFLGLLRCRGEVGNFRFANPLLLDGDFTDWRTVRIVAPNAERPAARFYDLPALREATDLPLRIRRAGFFSTPAFLGNYPTNPDNLFRVTVNQSLLVALGASFSPADATPPFESPALDPEHAAPGTPCHGCHTFLDPMRVAFWDQYSPNYQRVEQGVDFEGRFAFRGYRHDSPVNTPVAFGAALAAHPLFKSAWVQRLCHWANSQACDEGDPRFRALADGFEASGFDLRALVVDLLSSPLVTGLDPEAPPASATMVSITRANHLCPLIEARLGDDSLCDGIGAVLGLIPKDEFARGEAVPALTAAPNTFSFAAGEQLCLRIAGKLVGEGRALRTNDAPGALATLVERLMGLHPAHPRHDAALAALQAHFDEARAAPGGNAAVALRSTAMVACLSPDVMGVGL